MLIIFTVFKDVISGLEVHVQQTDVILFDNGSNLFVLVRYVGYYFLLL